MLELSSGTITFLFTDIENSLRLWEQYPEAMSSALARHNDLLQQAIRAHLGHVFKLWGDSVYAAFDTAADALSAAIEAQKMLSRELWGEISSLKVRMILHTGVAEARDGDYLGPTLNRCARLLAAAHSGQILLSTATEELIRDALPESVSLRSLGRHRLKDLQRPEHIFQVVHPDLQQDFPFLRTLDAIPNNLPVQLTSFIGREQEMEEIKRILQKTRLLTLTGSGGCGKTRLALQVAADLLEEYANGICLVELAALTDPALVPATVAAALGIHEEPARPIVVTLTEALKPHSTLLLLDNCEHLVAACARLTETLLRSCPKLCIIATSREALGIAGETTWRVPSLSVPDPHSLLTRETEIVSLITQYGAVRLFIERAIAALPIFQVTLQNALAIVQICRRLDGIPLAIELAAARVKVLSVEQIADRLDDRFRLLTGGSRTALPRQQTLRAMMDWSYDLLGEKERILFRKFAVFAGGFTLEAAEAICADEHIEASEMLDVLTNLVDKSLVAVEEYGETTRYRLLDTVRQYGRDKLVEAGDAVQIRQRQRDWFLNFAERAEKELQRPDQTFWLERLETEHDNLRAALEWSSSDLEAGLRFCGALWSFWHLRGHVSEGREWFKQFLGKSDSVPASLRAKALYGASLLARAQDDYSQATALLEESLELYQALKDKRGIASVLGNLAFIANARNDYARAVKLHEESLVHFRESGDTVGMALTLSDMGVFAFYQGSPQRAAKLFEEGLTLSRATADKRGIASALSGLGMLALEQGDAMRARKLLEEGLALYRELGAVSGLAAVLNHLSMVSTSQGEFEHAKTLLSESLTFYRDVGDRWHIALCLDRLARVAGAQQDWERAVKLFGSEEALREAIGAPLPPSERVDHECTVAQAHTELGEERFAATWADGYAMTPEQAIEYALSNEP